MAARILFVDDEPAVHDGIRRALRHFHHSWDLVFRNDPAEELALVEREAFAVAVLDLKMPGMDGVTLARAIKAIRPGINILMLTGHGDLETAMTMINAVGVFRFYLKPVEPEVLEAGLREALADAASAAEGGSASIAGDMLDMLPIGVLGVARDLAVRHMNAKAATILKARDGLSLDGGGHLRCASPEATRALKASVEGASQDTGPVFHTIERPSEARDYSVTVTGAGDPDRPGAGGGVAAFLFVADPEAATFPEAAAIGRTFGLTPSEARLVARLVQGDTIEEASQASGVTVSSGRTYLKSVFVKLGVGRQAEVVRRVLTSSAAFVRSDA